MIRRTLLTRFQVTALAIILMVAPPLVISLPVLAHSNNCYIGDARYVAIVFSNAGQTGSNDDTCFYTWNQADHEFSSNEGNVDDIGENANFHDVVSSMAMKSTGPSSLCIYYFQDPYWGVFREGQWVAAGSGDNHFNAAHNDNYDSSKFTFTSQANCHAGP